MGAAGGGGNGRSTRLLFSVAALGLLAADRVCGSYGGACSSLLSCHLLREDTGLF